MILLIGYIITKIVIIEAVMGSVCCVAARERNQPSSRTEIVPRNVVYSPSWSFRWDNRGRVAGEIETPSQVSHGISMNASMELKGTLASERSNISEAGSPLENYGSPTSQKSPDHRGTVTHLMTSPSDLSLASNYSPEVKNLAERPGIADSSTQNLPFPLPSTLSTPNSDSLATHTYPMFHNSTPSRQARRSPGHQLLRQVSDSRILGLKSPANNSISEGRPSFVLSTCSNDLANGSRCWSSDGWSMRTFSELVASSHRERWSFDSEHIGSINGKISECSSRFSYSPSIDLQTCGICSKLLTERSSWSSQKIIAGPELSVVSVLVCGHVYHAECLEAMTPDTDKFDPACPICMVGERQFSKFSKKVSKAEADLKSKIHKISKNRVVDSYLGGDFNISDPQKYSDRKGKHPKMEPSSSTRSSFAKPFLKRHFSLGSKWSRFHSENDTARKKGFWARYRKD